MTAGEKQLISNGKGIPQYDVSISGAEKRKVKIGPYAGILFQKAEKRLRGFTGAALCWTQRGMQAV